MDKKYNQDLNNFTANLIHYNDYVDNEMVANIIKEPYVFWFS